MRKIWSILVLFIAAAGTPVVFANDLDGLEMDVIGGNEAPDAMMQRIELPEAVRERERERGRGFEGFEAGKGAASEARDRGAEFGRDTSEAARERRGPPSDPGRPPGTPGGGASEAGQDQRPESPGDSRPETPDDSRPETPDDSRPETQDNGRPDGVVLPLL